MAPCRQGAGDSAPHRRRIKQNLGSGGRPRLIRSRILLVPHLAAAETARYIPPLLLRLEEGVVLLERSRILADIDIFDIGRFAPSLLDIFETDELDIVRLDLRDDRFSFSDLGRRPGMLALRRQQCLGDEADAAIRAYDRVLQQIIEAGPATGAGSLHSEFRTDHGCLNLLAS